MAQLIPSVPILTPYRAIFSGLCHLVGPGGVEFVRKPLPRDGVFVCFSDSYRYFYKEYF